ncbi:RING finger protein 24-like [Acanthaster planci]|uniref:RING finger protein 24-like n=1 Tax=Acanthaster planci TaxID=133434 RepID=A0A8B7Z2U7_ACAPL|nr:RING finger protein 24-like [Acanthaster planci]XP_022097696.1 RING finger protein 24-like [Acanthaster planci]XP_022097697.1 RING finger protein 24-like [Acanthaster planci]XP_022097698.1 RING finger protein 24-like [Acanthaster planci]
MSISMVAHMPNATMSDNLPLNFEQVLPFLVVAGLILLLNLVFCCYLLRLKRSGRVDTGFKTVSYTKKKIGAKFDTCSVCLEEFEEGTKIGQCACQHVFHVVCISKWLRLRNTCPICNAILRADVTERTSLRVNATPPQPASSTL